MKPYKPRPYPRITRKESKPEPDPTPKQKPKEKAKPEPLFLLSDDEVLNKTYEFAKLLREPITEVVTRIFEQMQADNYGCLVWGAVSGAECIALYFQFCLNKYLYFPSEISDEIQSMSKVSLAVSTLYGNFALELNVSPLEQFLDTADENFDFTNLHFTQNLIDTAASLIAESYGQMFGCSTCEPEPDFVFE